MKNQIANRKDEIEALKNDIAFLKSNLISGTSGIPITEIKLKISKKEKDLENLILNKVN